MKIIYVISFSPRYDYVREEEIPVRASKSWKNKDGLYGGIFEQDWGVVIGNEIMKINPSRQFEVWRPDYRADKIYSFVNPNGVTLRSFPSSFTKTRSGLKKKIEEYSGLMEQALEELYSCREKTIVIIPIADILLFRRIYALFEKRIPFLNPHFLNTESLLCKTRFSLNPGKLMHRLLLNRNYSRLLKRIRYVTLPQQQYSKELAQKYGWEISYFAAGFDPGELPYDLDKQEAREKLNLKQEDFVLLCSSRIVPEKQIDKLLVVLSGLKEYQWTCYITGYGPENYMKEMTMMQESLGLSGRVRFVGNVSFEKLKYYYQASDLFFMTSFMEAGPGSANMAAWYGLPIISTRTGSVAELLEQENAGYLVGPANYDEWKKALVFAFTGNKIALLDREILLRTKGRRSNMERLSNTITTVFESFYKD